MLSLGIFLAAFEPAYIACGEITNVSVARCCFANASLFTFDTVPNLFGQ